MNTFKWGETFRHGYSGSFTKVGEFRSDEIEVRFDHRFREEYAKLFPSYPLTKARVWNMYHIYRSAPGSK
jgi:hypothetical protein